MAAAVEVRHTVARAVRGVAAAEGRHKEERAALVAAAAGALHTEARAAAAAEALRKEARAAAAWVLRKEAPNAVPRAETVVEVRRMRARVAEAEAHIEATRHPARIG